MSKKRCPNCGQYKEEYIEFTVRSTGVVNSWCKVCCNVKAKQYQAKNGRPPDKRIRREKTVRMYGITHDDYNDKLEEQNYACAICKIDMQELDRLMDIDHDHNTGVFRGLLCPKCNKALGLLGDNVETLLNAIEYLRRYE